MSNRVTLAEMQGMGVEQVANLPVDQLALLLEDVAKAKANAASLDDKLSAALSRRFADRAAELRQADGKDTGRVRIEEGDHVVIADLPKSVIWDQKRLAEAEEVVRSWGENVAEFIAIKRSVSETKYTAWPSTIRKVFEPARTLKAGKPSFAIEPKREAA